MSIDEYLEWWKEKPMTDQPQTLPEAIALADQRIEEAREAKAIELYAYGQGLQFTPESLQAVEQDLANYLRVSTLAALEAGKRLLWVRENIGDNNRFEQWIHDRTGFSRRTAYSHMALARRMMDKRLSHFFDLDLSKVRALCDLSNEDLDRFAADGRIGDLTADDVERLSASELKDQVRALRQRVKDGAIAEVEHERQIEQLEVELGRAARRLDEQLSVKCEASRIALHQLFQLLEKVDYDKPVESLEEIFGTREAAREMLSTIERYCERIVSLSRSMDVEDIHRTVVRGPVDAGVAAGGS